MPSQNIENSAENFNSAEANADGGSAKELQRPSVEQRLKETEKMIKQLEQWGVRTAEEINQEGQKLEIDYQEVMADLKAKLGPNTISEGSERLVHQHLVDDVLNFRQHVQDRFQELQKNKNKLKEEETGDQKKKVDVAEIASESSSVGEFKRKLRNAAEENPKDQVLEQAATNISRISTGHEHYAVKEKLDDVDGLQTAGVTEMDASGGGDITISAEHLAGVVTKEGRDDIKRTFKHEEAHGEQARLKTSENGVAVVDPVSGREMTEAELHEGGAVHATKDLGSEADESAAPVYKQGANFFRRNRAQTINEHLNKKGEHAGDRVHLQAALAKEAHITEPNRLKKIAKDAGFTDIEKARFFRLMKIKDDSKKDKGKLAA